MSEMNFDRLYQFFCKVPSVQESRIVAHGTDGQHAWWFKFNINVEGVQTEVDAGYEGKDQIVLIEAKNIKTKNVIIRQLYYPFRQWSIATGKKVTTIFFQKDNKSNLYSIWQFGFNEEEDYNSIELLLAGKYIINNKKSH